MAESQQVLFAPRFLESMTGANILRAPRIALVELIANAWDAGATRVDVKWPASRTGRFEVKDNGHGMTAEEFDHRWRTLKYDRLDEQGATVNVTKDGVSIARRVFGRNGIGRFAGFCFADQYFVESWKDGASTTHRVEHDDESPVKTELISSKKRRGHGTRVFMEDVEAELPSEDDVRSEIGTRFLSDPSFDVFVNAKRVHLGDIPDTQVERETINVPDVGEIELVAIESSGTDRSTLQHGIAWHVNGRLVGDCSWKGRDKLWMIDGRRSAAKRFTFLIKADCLQNGDAILEDWTGFKHDNEAFDTSATHVYSKIVERLNQTTEQERAETLRKAKQANREHLRRMTLRSAETWIQFVQETQLSCPSIREETVIQLAGILANLEGAKSRFGIIDRLGSLSVSELDDLHDILGDWTVDTAKTVLDELRNRMLLLQKLERLTVDEKTDEVQELQPLFEQGLWIFGPEFETIEFTSNRGMTTVIQKLLHGKKLKGSLNRPDFVIVPDGSVGLYSYPEFCPTTGSEIGVSRLVILELKKPGIPISTDQKDQCWKYVKELHEKGLLQQTSSVICYPLGEQVDPLEREPRIEMNGKVTIHPLDYGVVIQRAKSRLLKLYERVRQAPFLQTAALAEFERGANDSQKTLF